MVYFGNGIDTNAKQAYNQARILKGRLATILSTREIATMCFRVAFNNPFSKLSDVLESAGQLLGNELPSVVIAQTLRANRIPGIVLTPSLQDKLNKLVATEFATKLFQGAASQADVVTQVGNYKRDLTAQKKVVVVAHLQGNIFANLSYNELDADPALNQNNFARFGVIPVASPDYRRLGVRAGWVTFTNDTVINGVQILRAAFGVQPALAANDTAENPKDPNFVHSFVEDYLADPSAKKSILDNIISTFAALPPPPPATEPYASQPSYTGNCVQRPPDSICIGFDDGYIWLVLDSAINSHSFGEPFQGKAVQIAHGVAADYYHVLGTDLVLRVPKLPS